MSSRLRLVVVFFAAAVALFTIACGGNGNNCINPAAPGCGGPTTRHFTTLEYDRDPSDPFYSQHINDLNGLQLTIEHRVLQQTAGQYGWVWQTEMVIQGTAMTVVNLNPGVFTVTINRDWIIGDQYRMMVGDPVKGGRIAHVLILDGVRLTPTPEQDGGGNFERAYITVQ